MEDQPKNYPTAQASGKPLKPITEVLIARRATVNFKTDEEVPAEILEAILRFGAQAPSGYNFQPWRFIVVRDQANRDRLKSVAFGQPKIGQAPVVIIAIGMKEAWEETADEVFREGAKRGAGNPDTVDKAKQGAIDFVSSLPLNVWVNRHTMIALTTMMLVAESYGFDTAMMEGFDAAGIKREFGIPEEGEVVALLAIGRVQEPDKVYTGRFPLNRIAFSEQFGEAWKSSE